MRVGKQELAERFGKQMRAQYNMPVTKAGCENTINCLISILQDALMNHDEIVIPDFGALKVRTTKPRPGRNPHSGETVYIPARSCVKFTPGKAFITALREKD